ncbi:hypothetical protein [Rhodovulum visakhapatnamense]|uniref:Uncharacterized protein n=1 Tax=Rhodovulum visakhapatnamense TaxID=364297 RepID=A0ABS1RES1_9RHOB|nr:hypothetical protein [Rhodovulum visakhapatnamense]MBL3568814.1 hypothetical protein [Rhodovulum visakhapatnamense]MBL3578141.1 hypothetical protein [Rhodovulum visakhapatnamense]
MSMTENTDAPERRENLSNDDIVSRILGFTLFCMGLSRAPADQVARGRGWLDDLGQPTDDGKALIEALMSRDSAYGVYKLVY